MRGHVAPGSELEWFIPHMRATLHVFPDRWKWEDRKRVNQPGALFTASALRDRPERPTPSCLPRSMRVSRPLELRAASRANCRKGYARPRWGVRRHLRADRHSFEWVGRTHSSGRRQATLFVPSSPAPFTPASRVRGLAGATARRLSRSMSWYDARSTNGEAELTGTRTLC